MKKYIMTLIVNWLASTVTEEKVKEFMNDLKAKFVPKLEAWAKELIADLTPKVAESETKIDDAGLKALEAAIAVIIGWLKK